MIKNEFEANLEMKNIHKPAKYIINPNSNYDETNMYFKNTNLINEAELTNNRKFKIINNNDLGSQSSKSYKFRDYLSENNNNNENFSSRANYIGNNDSNYRNESKKLLN